MKKLSKKTLALIMAIIMVVTSIPVIAFNVFAQDDALDIAMSTFEGYITAIANNGASSMRKNLSPAYEKYLDAVEVDDNAEATLQQRMDAAVALNTAIANCEIFSSPSTESSVKFGSSNVESSYFNNIIYTDGASGSWDKAAMYEKESNGGVVWTYAGYFYTYYPNTVILYDGQNVPKIPVILAARQRSNNTTYHLESARLISSYLGINTNWKGYDNTSTFMWPSNSDSEVVFSEDYIDTNKRIKLTEDNSSYDIFKNYMVYSPSNEPVSGLFTIPSTEMYISLYYRNVAFGGDEDRVFANVNNSNSNIYVINYKILSEALDTSLSTYKNDLKNEQYIKDGSLAALFEAYDTATAINPYNEDYSSSIGTTANKVGTDIDNAVKQIKQAKPSGSLARARMLQEYIEDVYVPKMNSGKVYSNMLDAYKYYMIAQELTDAYNYADKTSDSWDDETMSKALATAYENLKIKTEAMSEREGNYSYYPDAGFDGDSAADAKCDDYKNAYKNLVWAGQAPTRTRDDNAKCPSNILKINESYATSYLYIGDAVGVYDGSSSNDEITLPAILGFTAEGSEVSDPGRRIYSYWSNDSLPSSYSKTFSYGVSPQTKTTTGLDFITNWQTLGTADSPQYTESCSLNTIMNNGNHTDALSHTYDGTGLHSQIRYTNFSNIDDKENFYSSIIKVNTVSPSDSSKTVFDSRSGVQKYYYCFDRITCMSKTYVGNKDSEVLNDSSKGDIGNRNSGAGYLSDGYSSNSGKEKSTFAGFETGNSTSNTLDSLSIYVINYKPVRDIINQNDSLLKDSNFDIRNYLEGGLEKYLSDLDRLTDVDPANVKYQYVDSSSNDQHDTTAIQCATDIYNLLEGEDKVSLTDSSDPATLTNTDGSPYVKEDTLNTEDAPYTLLKEQLDDDTNYEKGCFNDDVWNAYINAVKNGRDAMANVASNAAMTIATNDITYITNGYVEQYNGIDIEDYAQAIKTAKLDLNELNSHHIYSFFKRSDDDKEIGCFRCSKNQVHPESQTSLEAYDAMSIVYSMLDITRYNASGKALLQKGKSLFDEVLESDMSKMSESGTTIGEKREEAILYILANVPVDERPNPSQALVDNGIAELLTEINTANEDANVESFSVKLNVVKVENGTKTAVEENIDITPETYGTLISADASSYTDGQTVSNWTVQNGSVSQSIIAKGNTLPIYVQGGDTVVTAYYTPAKTETTISVNIKNVIGDALYNITVSKDTDIALKTGDINTLVIGETEYNVPNTSSYHLDAWKVNGERVSSINGKAEDLADKDGNIALVPVTSRTVTDKYSLTLDGNPLLDNDVAYDYHYYGLGKPSSAEFIAILDEGVYKPVTYNDSYEFYVNGLLHNFYTVTKQSDGYYAGATKIDYSDEELFKLKNKLPFVSSVAEKVSDSNYTVRSIITVGSSAEITEWGTLYSRNPIGEDEMTIENVGVKDGLAKVPLTKKIDFSNQFAQPFVINSSTKFPIYTRTYVKFTYTYEGKEYPSVAYSNLNICFNS